MGSIADQFIRPANACNADTGIDPLTPKDLLGAFLITAGCIIIGTLVHYCESFVEKECCGKSPQARKLHKLEKSIQECAESCVASGVKDTLKHLSQKIQEMKEENPQVVREVAEPPSNCVLVEQSLAAMF